MLGFFFRLKNKGKERDLWTFFFWGGRGEVWLLPYKGCPICPYLSLLTGAYFLDWCSEFAAFSGFFVITSFHSLKTKLLRGVLLIVSSKPNWQPFTHYILYYLLFDFIWHHYQFYFSLSHLPVWQTQNPNLFNTHSLGSQGHLTGSVYLQMGNMFGLLFHPSCFLSVRAQHRGALQPKLGILT